MQQSIRYKGLSLTPDEMAVENGALSLCGNLELHDGALRPAIVSGTPLSQPLTVGGEVAKILYVHETGSYHHLIAIASSSIYWFMQDGTLGSSTPIKSFTGNDTVLSIQSVGNTLVIIASDGIHYALWQDDGYLFLGQKPPFLELSFQVDTEDTYEDYELGGVDGEGSKVGFNEAIQQTTFSCSELFNKVKNTDWNKGDICINIKSDKQADLTEAIYALVNRTNNLIARNGRFYANFFVRYCYRMFDGSMIMHSAPCFMPVQVPDNYDVYSPNFTFPYASVGVLNSKYFISGNEVSYSDKFVAYRKDKDGVNHQVNFEKACFAYRPRNVELYYMLYGDVEELKKWGDIIKSIDIFITPPITNIDTSDKISSLCITKENYSLGRGSVTPHSTGANYADVDGNLRTLVSVNFSKLSDDVYKNKLQNASAFYLLSSFNVSDLSPTLSPQIVAADKNVVYQISLQEQMKDDYKSHNFLYANGGYVYNHRLNLYGVKEKLFAGFSRRVLFPGILTLRQSGSGRLDSIYNIKKIVVQLSTSSGTKYVENQFNDLDTTGLAIGIESYVLFNLSKFYPDTRAEKMVFFVTDTSSNEDSIFVFKLTECKELNGAMQMGDFKASSDAYKVSSFPYSVDDVVDMGNKIYTSESDNAFYFPLNGINTVGIGTILGIASTTRALSQGQFGQYPLMAFSTDGIWAMEVSSQGTYSSIHPISREVCSNPKSITQLDQSVLFATNRSLSRIAESQVATMSDVLDGPGFNIAANLGKFLYFFNDAEGDDDVTKTIKAQMRQLIDFTSSPIDFFQRCQVIYDYKNSRIFCLDVSQLSKEASADTVALCYSIKDEAWSTFLIKNVLTALNSYPHPYIQYRDGSVIALDSSYDYEDDTEYHGIIVTRTLKFDEENAPDAITGYIHSLTSGTVPVMWLYGSNDNQHWHYLGRCGGMKSSYMSSHSYRFFRIALYLKMKSMNQYFATRLEVIRRFNKF